jgi:hypothetical protein
MAQGLFSGWGNRLYPLGFYDLERAGPPKAALSFE